MIPPPINCPRCGKPAGVNVFLRAFICNGCFWQRPLTSEENKACWRVIPSPSERAMLETPPKERPVQLQERPVWRPPKKRTEPVYFPGDCVADLEKAPSQGSETDLLMNLIRQKAGVRK